MFILVPSLAIDGSPRQIMLGTPDHKDVGWLDNLCKYISQSGKKVEEIVKKYKSKMLIVTPLQVVSK